MFCGPNIRLEISFIVMLRKEINQLKVQKFRIVGVWLSNNCATHPMQLKQFQKKRQKDPSGVGGDDSSSEPRSSPFTTTSFYNENQHHEVR
jgi:hypothetical protein